MACPQSDVNQCTKNHSPPFAWDKEVQGVLLYKIHTQLLTNMPWDHNKIFKGAPSLGIANLFSHCQSIWVSRKEEQYLLC